MERSLHEAECEECGEVLEFSAITVLEDMDFV